MRDIPLVRRCALVAISLVIAGVMFRGSIASALVTRGDDALAAGDRRLAFLYYQRATTIDPASGVAADRFAFYLALNHRPLDAKRAIVVAGVALRDRPQDGALFADRGLAEQELRLWRPAERDFSLAARYLHDARYECFAGTAARQFGDLETARRHFQQALRDDPTFAPARNALRSMTRP